MPINIEIKARCSQPDSIRRILEARGAIYKGVDHQIDTYFRVAHGRLKLREGNIENALIHYQRANQAGPKQSTVTLYQAPADPQLKAALSAALGVLVVVDKQRHIYFIDNIKFHVDTVKELGNFVEIEAIDTTGQYSTTDLQQSCFEYMELFNIQKEDLLETSYSDLLREMHSNTSILTAPDL